MYAPARLSAHRPRIPYLFFPVPSLTFFPSFVPFSHPLLPYVFPLRLLHILHLTNLCPLFYSSIFFITISSPFPVPYLTSSPSFSLLLPSLQLYLVPLRLLHILHQFLYRSISLPATDPLLLYLPLCLPLSSARRSSVLPLRLFHILQLTNMHQLFFQSTFPSPTYPFTKSFPLLPLLLSLPYLAFPVCYVPSSLPFVVPCEPPSTFHFYCMPLILRHCPFSYVFPFISLFLTEAP